MPRNPENIIEPLSTESSSTFANSPSRQPFTPSHVTSGSSKSVPPGPSSPELNFLLTQIQAAAQRQFSGHLCLAWSHQPAWGLTFRHGRLVWAWANCHRLRRWKRLLGQRLAEQVAQVSQISLNPNSPTWEYETFRYLIGRGDLEREAALTLIRQNIVEVLFELLQVLNSVGHPPQQVEFQPFKLERPLQFFSSSALLSDVQQAWEDWCDAQLQAYSPMLAPLIHQPEKLRSMVSDASYRNLERLLQGQLSLRDLALVMNQNLIHLTQLLVSYERRCLIKFKPLADPLADQYPTHPGNETQQQRAIASPLVLCIDDSFSVCEQLGQVVQTHGYRYEALQHPLEGLQRVIEVRPDLIFLDLVMPIMSGYDLCAQIRRISDLRHIPIVILTGSDSVLDRVRAKMTGATDFLSKPICPQAIQKILNHYSLADAA